ncbi:MAG TPA: NADH-quinone oxidoreductase subunit NuoH [Candidatus Xenobia bacterium]|nr:NADH-quinone oxidoreductase subunit NuoH [Candidatus Xenobia bacterium]
MSKALEAVMSYVPQSLQPFVLPTIQILIVFAGLSLLVAYLVYAERKILAHLQVRLGPMRVGPHGLLQPIADGLKLLLKEDIIPRGADKFLFWLAPIISVMAAFTGFALIPFANNFMITDVNVGLLFILGISSLGIYGIILGGWASNSHYPLLGALRSTAQLVSYEVALGFAIVSALLLGGTLSLRGIVEAQLEQGVWFAFVQPVAFFILFVAAIAETNRNPFDLPEAESELVAGFHTEYSGFRFSLYFLAEYTAMTLVSAIAVTLFLGGWLRPFPSVAWLDFLKYTPVALLLFAAYWCIVHGFRLPKGREWRWQRLILLALGGGAALLGAVLAIPAVADAVQGVFWFLLKVSLFLYAFIWFRGTFPRYRFDQLMRLGWHFMIPVAIANTIFCGAALVLWKKLEWSFVGTMWIGTLLTLLFALLLARERAD